MKRKTQESFIEECNLKHNSFYSYKDTIYTTGNSYIIIECPVHGRFEQRANSHLSGSGCKKCIGMTSHDFFEKCKLVHQHKYAYQNVIYNGLKNSLELTCTLHGNFSVNAHSHLYLKVGCKTCLALTSRRYSTKTFVEKANKVHKFKYNYSNTVYTGSLDKVEIQCNFGHCFKQTANDHLNGSGCSICAGHFGIDYSKVVELSTIKHKGYYKYPLQDVTSRSDIMTVECPIHGLYKQKVRNHLKGSGCTKCSYKYSGWTKTTFRSKCLKNNEGKGFLYVIKCFNENETFFKIGITSRTLKQRFSHTKRMPYNYEVIQHIEEYADVIYDLEVLLHKIYKKHQYNPKIPFGGSLTECFKI